MLDNLEYENDVIEFFDIQNLYFDHPLSNEELEELKTVVLGLNNLTQIYFKDNVDLITIEKVKNLLLMSSSVKDSKIEKVVTCNLKDEELNYLVNSSFENPNTWSIAYFHDGNNYLVDTIPRVREFLTYIEKIKNVIRKERLSQLEKILRVYDIVKLIDYEESSKNYSLPEIVINNKSNTNGFNKLFSYILHSLSINNYLGYIKGIDNKKSLITIVAVSDSKYKIDGYYLFDPSMDSLPKDTYKDNIRMINYNYFGLKLEDFMMNNYGDYLLGILGILAINDYDYAKEKLSVEKDIKVRRELNKISTTFRSDLETLHTLIHNIDRIDIKIICTLVSSIYGDTLGKDFIKVVKTNYNDRKKELFKENIHERFKRMLDKE